MGIVHCILTGRAAPGTYYAKASEKRNETKIEGSTGIHGQNGRRGSTDSFDLPDGGQSAVHGNVQNSSRLDGPLH